MSSKRRTNVTYKIYCSLRDEGQEEFRCVVQRKYSKEWNYTSETVIARNLLRGFIFLHLNTVNTVSRFFRFLDGLDGPHLTFENLVGSTCVQTARVRACARGT